MTTAPIFHVHNPLEIGETFAKTHHILRAKEIENKNLNNRNENHKNSSKSNAGLISSNGISIHSSARMHAVMGTMRKMEDPEMEDKMVASNDRRLHAAPLNGTVARKRSLGGGATGGGRSKTALREVDKWKRMAAYKAAMKTRPTAMLSASSSPAYLNGRKISGRRERDVRLSETPSSNQGTAMCTVQSFVELVHRGEENLPMDLSRRSADDDRVRDDEQNWAVDSNEDEDNHDDGGGRNGGRRHRVDDHFVRFDSHGGDEMVIRFDEPLNLSRTYTNAVKPLEVATSSRWNGCQTRAPPSGHSSNSGGGSSDEHHGHLSSSHAQALHVSAPPVLQQKRVRLEEMVTFIRKCSGVEGATIARGQRPHKMVEEGTIHRNGGHDWGRNGGHDHHYQVERRRHHYQRHLSASGGDFNGGGDDGYDIALNGVDDYTDDEDDDEMDVDMHSHPPSTLSRRLPMVQVDYDARSEMAPLPPSYHQHHEQQLRRRRKSATPYRGGHGSSLQSASDSPRSAQRRTDNNAHDQATAKEHRHRSINYDFDDRPEHQPIRLEVIAASSTALAASTTPTINGLHGISYPVLRQQLQGMSRRHPVSTQITGAVSPNGVDDRAFNTDEDDLDGQQPDVVRGHDRVHQNRRRTRHPSRHDMDEMEPDVHDRHAIEEVDDGGNVQPMLTQQHLRLLAATAPPHLAWSSYANNYVYANMLQGLQGSLMVTGAKSNSQAGSQPPALPLTLSLPLTIHGSGPRSESPGSIDDDDDDDDPNTLALSSPDTLHHKNNGGSGGGIVTGGTTNGGGLVAIATEVAAANAALFRKRAPRALTGKHVKHGTGASPTTLLTLRQKIEQKRQQQLVTQTTKPPSGGGGQKSKAVSEGNGALLKAIKAGTLLQKKTMVS